MQRGTKVVFKVLSFIMKLAPLGAFGAMAYAIGKYGVSTLTSLGGLIALFYLTSAFFVLVVLGSVMGYLKLNIFKLLRYLKEELLLIVGTSTAEPALPGLMRKMEYAGARRAPSASSSPPATPSTWTAPRSTCRWPRCTSRRPPTRT